MIKITDEMAIKADKRSYSICFLQSYTDSKTGETVNKWSPEFHFTEPQHVFDKLVKLAVSDGINDGSWDDVAKRVKDTRELIAEQLKPVLVNSGLPEGTFQE